MVAIPFRTLFTSQDLFFAAVMKPLYPAAGLEHAFRGASFSAEQRCCNERLSVGVKKKLLLRSYGAKPADLESCKACRPFCWIKDTPLKLVAVLCAELSTLVFTCSIADQTLSLQKQCFKTEATLNMVRCAPFTNLKNRCLIMFNISNVVLLITVCFKFIINSCVVKSHMVLSLVDYETVRIAGLILAVIMCVFGILIALSKFRL